MVAMPSPELSLVMASTPWASIASRQSTLPRVAARWNLQREQGLWDCVPCPQLCPQGRAWHPRRFALRVQLGGHQALAEQQRCDPPGIVVVHGLQQLLVVLGPVLALQRSPEEAVTVSAVTVLSPGQAEQGWAGCPCPLSLGVAVSVPLSGELSPRYGEFSWDRDENPLQPPPSLQLTEQGIYRHSSV